MVVRIGENRQMLNHVLFDASGNIVLDEDGLPIPKSRFSKYRNHPTFKKSVAFIENQNPHLRGVIPSLLILSPFLYPFPGDSIICTLMLLFMHSFGILMAAFMLLFMGCWNISILGFDPIQNKALRVKYFSKVENLRKRRREAIILLVATSFTCIGYYAFIWKYS